MKFGRRCYSSMSGRQAFRTRFIYWQSRTTPCHATVDDLDVMRSACAHNQRLARKKGSFTEVRQQGGADTRTGVGHLVPTSLIFKAASKRSWHVTRLSCESDREKRNRSIASGRRWPPVAPSSGTPVDSSSARVTTILLPGIGMVPCIRKSVRISGP